MKYFALIYYLVDDYVTQRAKFREEHLRLANASVSRGEMLIGGAFAEPTDRALLIFRTADINTVEEFVKQDPYFINGLITRYEIRSWSVVIGNN